MNKIVVVTGGAHGIGKCVVDEFRKNNDTVEVIGSFSEKDDRLVLTKNKKWLGTMGSRIKGIELASGEYICFIDSDDYVESNYVEALLNAICECDVDIAFTKSQMINRGNVVDLDVPFEGIVSSEEYIPLAVQGHNPLW